MTLEKQIAIELKKIADQGIEVTTFIYEKVERMLRMQSIERNLFIANIKKHIKDAK